MPLGTSLADLTTLELGGPARQIVVAGSIGAIVQAVGQLDGSGERLFVLGGGSNVVFPDEGFDGTVVRIAARGVVTDGDLVEVAAGEPWDDVVAWAVQARRSGIECLSGIPGLTGATPIQNVGAYGQEIRDTLAFVDAWDRGGRALVRLLPEACGLSYRHSMFKESVRYVVVRVALRLPFSSTSRPVRYAELARALGVREGETAPVARVREAVLALRRGKGMVLDANDPDTRSAGSFFVNPTMTRAAYDALVARAGEPVPLFDSDGRVKVPAAWLIERAGFRKGHARGKAAISTKHALALTNRGGATSRDVLDLAREIRDGVEARFGVKLVPEPVLVGCGLGDEERLGEQ